ncbi:Rv1733c family protein [Nocardia aurantia]|uniref:Transmembrane protein n=1 Tax=Nocardia aurantia TaxID=2585199 RepID=A0A7K0DUM9_9NOCA|nr:hypothetical protein [Nocardia aurantia]MQY29288.1 hypothetical protein [Nocardia aurantia]
MTSAKRNRFTMFPSPRRTVRAWRNPLMPAGYRIRYALRVLLLIIAVAAIPAAVTVGTNQYHRLTANADRERAGLHEVVAVTDVGSSLLSPENLVASAHWSYNDVPHTGIVPVQSARHLNDPIPILVNADGDRVTPPSTRSQNLGDAVLTALFAYGAVVLALTLTLWGADHLINRHRYRLWSREWQLLASDRRWNLPAP